MEHNKQIMNLKEADGTGLNIMKCPLLHNHHFYYKLKKGLSGWREVEISLYGSKSKGIGTKPKQDFLQVDNMY